MTHSSMRKPEIFQFGHQSKFFTCMCSLLIHVTFGNSLDLGQAQHVFVPDLDQKLKLFDFHFINNFNVYIPERFFEIQYLV